MGEKFVNTKSNMIKEEDLKRKDNSLQQLVFLELDVFHLHCHRCQRRILLQALILMIFLWGIILETQLDHYHYDILHS